MKKNIMVLIAVVSLLLFSYFVGASEEIYFYHNDPFGYPVARANEREETGLIFDGSRYYCPELGRYLTPDMQDRKYNPYIPKPDEQMKYNNPILTQSHEIAKAKNKHSWIILTDQISWLIPENQFQLRELIQNSKIAYNVDLWNPISIIERSRQMIKDRLYS
jgi:hypothetical protein